MLDWVWYSILDIRFECEIEFDIRYSTFKILMLNVEYRTSNQILIATIFLQGSNVVTSRVHRYSVILVLQDDGEQKTA